MKLVYRYTFNEETHKYHFLDEYSCQKDPEERGSYLIPFNSTEEKPQLIENKIAYFEDNQWKYMDDYKFITYYSKEDGSSVNGSDINYFELEYKYTKEKPLYKYPLYDNNVNAWKPNIEAYKKQFHTEVKQLSTSSYEINTKPYLRIIFTDGREIDIDYTQETTAIVLSIIKYLQLLPLDSQRINFRLYDNSIANLSLDDINHIYTELMKSQQIGFYNKWQVKDTINSIQTWEQVEAFANQYNIDISI